MAKKPKANVLGPGYQVISELGRGSMGVTYEVQHPRVPKRFALKMLLSPATPAEKAGSRHRRHAMRFAREVQAMATLCHPNILPIYDCDLQAGDPFYVTELCEGGCLRVPPEGLEPCDIVPTVYALCSALGYAHSQGVVHRDIKPENILFDAAGTVRLGDFGMCKFEAVGRLTGPEGSLVGTMLYMAPEQAQNPHAADVRSDIYSLGRTIRHMLTGSAVGTGPPSRETTPGARRDRVREWDAAVRAMTELEADRRPQAVSEAVALFDRIPAVRRYKVTAPFSHPAPRPCGGRDPGPRGSSPAANKTRMWVLATKPAFRRVPSTYAACLEEADELRVMIDLRGFAGGEMSIGLCGEAYVVQARRGDVHLLEEIPVPPLVDVRRVAHHFSGGVLEIVLPRRKRRSARR